MKNTDLDLLETKEVVEFHNENFDPKITACAKVWYNSVCYLGLVMSDSTDCTVDYKSFVNTRSLIDSIVPKEISNALDSMDEEEKDTGVVYLVMSSTKKTWIKK